MRESFLRWHWMPLTVFVIGALSIALLLWGYRIHERQLDDFEVVDALKDMRSHTATFHLWLEEELAGDANIDSEILWYDLESAISLIGAVLHGGSTDHGSILIPLTDAKMLARAEALQTLLLELKATALERVQESDASGIGSSIDKRFDALFLDILEKAGNLENIIAAETVRNKTRTERFVAGMLLAWMFIIVAATAGLFSRELRRKAAEKDLRKANEQLLAQAVELSTHREHLAEMVEQRTGELSAANRRLHGEVIERVHAEEALKDSQKQLRRLSSRLLSAQEEERNRISRELHDELGQSLTLVKLRLRSVEKRLSEDQTSLKDECGEILRYLNTVIENVRRLSRDLCPFVLDDLGLTRALQWMSDNITQNYQIRLDLDMTNIDHLFAKNDQTNIYRIIQEACTNIVKHSGASRASVSVRGENGGLVFTIADNGRGFDAAEAAAREAGRGLGLASMEERVRMLGGKLELRSEAGKGGTRISFTLPVREEQEPYEQHEPREQLSHHISG